MSVQFKITRSNLCAVIGLNYRDRYKSTEGRAPTVGVFSDTEDVVDETREK